MTPWLEVLNSALLLAILGVVWHGGQRLGAMQTKIDAMWEWWTKNGKEH